MSAAPEKATLPNWLLWLGSAAILFHLLALVIVVLAVPSGPWSLPPLGSDRADPPAFATQISDFTTQYYLQPLQLAANYHFESNRTDYDTVYFEALLRDSNGKVFQTIRFPQSMANFWVSNRQVLLAQNLGADDPVEPPRSEIIPAPGQRMPTVFIWSDLEDGVRKLQEVPQHRIPRDRPVFRPTESAMGLARSYARHLCREYGAASVELIRHSRTRLFPIYMLNDPPPGAFDELICSFGETRLEK
jgi:hypothetical protein